MAYFRNTKRDLIDRTGRQNANGCNTYSLYNIGNTRVFIDGILPLLPGEQFEGPNEHPEIFDYSDIDVKFDDYQYNGQNLTTNIDQRLIITRSYVTKKNETILPPVIK